MNPRLIRQILFVKAVESRPAENAILTAEQRQSATQNALDALRASEPASRQTLAAKQRYVLNLLSHRAQALAAALQQQAPSLSQRLQAGTGMPARWWVYAGAALAFMLGFTLDRIADPHQINLLSPPMLGILVWNLAVYLLLLVRPVLALVRKAPASAAPSRWLHVRSWSLPFKSQGGRRLPRQEAAIAQQFWTEWLAVSAPVWQARLALGLHLCAGALALGLLSSLWLTGLSTEYRVGWESTLLNAQQVQWVLNLLSWPAHALLATPLWSLPEVQWLGTWPVGTQAEGLRWLTIYTVLVLTVVALPRLLLAVWAGLRCRTRAQALRLPLSQAYFRDLIKDFNSDLCHLVVQPYSLQISQARQTRIEAFVHAQYGQAAHCHFLPPHAYGVDLQAGNDEREAGASDPDSTLYALLLNLAATPEKEAHGAALAHWRARYGGRAEVWVYCLDYAERLAAQGDGAARLAERKRLWAHFIEDAGLSPIFMEAP